MTANIDNLVGRLRERRLSPERIREFEALGDVAFDRLKELVSAGRLSDRQLGNAIHVLHALAREACFGRFNELLEILIPLIQSGTKEIRGDAAARVAQLGSLALSFPELDIPLAKPSVLTPILEEAIASGVRRNHEERIRAYLAERGR
jgi:hypothetical protein